MLEPVKCTNVTVFPYNPFEKKRDFRLRPLAFSLIVLSHRVHTKHSTFTYDLRFRVYFNRADLIDFIDADYRKTGRTKLSFLKQNPTYLWRPFYLLVRVIVSQNSLRIVRITYTNVVTVRINKKETKHSLTQFT